jgi:hypothetical protein
MKERCDVRVQLHLWPESQTCVGCKHGCLVNEPELVGSSAYVCIINHDVEGCRENDQAMGESNYEI